MTQAKLASRASDLTRRIYASLPLRYRIAKLLFHLKIADDFIKRNVGQALYTEFIRAGVTGMPDIRGVGPALSLQEKVLDAGHYAANVKELRGYGSGYGGEMWMVASKFLHTRNPEAIADVLQNVVAEVYNRNKEGLNSKLKATSLKSAESYIRTLVALRAKDWLKKKDHGESSITEQETGGQPDLLDISALKGLLGMIDRSDYSSFKREIDGIDSKNPGRPWSYIEMVMEGYRPADIARDWGVNRSVVTNKLKDWLPDLKRIFLKYTEDAGGYAQAM